MLNVDGRSPIVRALSWLKQYFSPEKCGQLLATLITCRLPRVLQYPLLFGSYFLQTLQTFINVTFDIIYHPFARLAGSAALLWLGFIGYAS